MKTEVIAVTDMGRMTAGRGGKAESSTGDDDGSAFWKPELSSSPCLVIDCRGVCERFATSNERH